MRIAIYIDTIGFGGAERQAIRDANMFASYGHEVALIYCYYGEQYSNMISDSVSLHPLMNRGPIYKYFSLLKALINFQPNVIMSHQITSNMLSTLAARTLTIPNIVVEHGVVLRSSSKHKMLRRIYFAYANKIICVCKETLGVRKYRDHAPVDKLAVVYNSYDPSIFQTCLVEDETYVDYSRWIRRFRYVIGSVGRFEKVKRYDVLLRIGKYIRSLREDVCLVLVGDGDERKRLENFIESNRMREFVRLVPFTRDIGKYYISFDIFVSCSRIEANSLALIEAQSFGLPCVAFDVGGNSETVPRSAGMLCDYPEYMQMNRAIMHIIDNQDVREYMGTAARENAMKMFSPQARYAQLMKNINEIVMRPSATK